MANADNLMPENLMIPVQVFVLDYSSYQANKPFSKGSDQ